VVVAVVVVLLGLASSASAAVHLDVTVPLPDVMEVGQTGDPGALQVINSSTGAEASGNVTLSAITLVPSCGSLSFGDCPAADVDPGVFSVSTGVGEFASACAGMTFAVSTLDASQGKLALTPSGTVVLGRPTGGNSFCRIDFTLNVQRLPAKDSDPKAGLQTAQLGAVTGTSTATGSSGTGFQSSEVAVSPGTPTISTQVSSASATTGATIADTATVTASAGSPAPTGSVTFNVYGPGDTSCATPIAMSTKSLSGSTATSTAVTAAMAGTYRFVATYNGDANNTAAAGVCGDVNESVAVTAQPTIATHVASATAAIGDPISDTATVSPGTGAPAPTGSVTFKIYGPGDTTCTTPLSTVIANLTGTTATSAPPTFTTSAAGTYQFVATYNGDALNNAATGHCGDANESVTVSSTDEKPTAAYTPSTFSPTVGQTVSFNGTASNDPDGTITTYRWVWGDGTPNGSGATPTHAFATAGTYSVGLYITDSAGQTAAVGHGFTVAATDEKPTAAYTPSTFSPTVAQTVSFNATASHDPDGSITTYRWVWGDGTPDGSGATPTHAFATAGTYSVGLYITDSSGQTAAVGHGFTVGPADEKPTAAYTPSTFRPVVGQTVSFNGTASNDPDGSITTYRWAWGDGTPDGSGATPTHAFAAAGTYSVGLYITDSSGQTAAVGHGFTVTGGA
jgi:PKD repeat protein